MDDFRHDGRKCGHARRGRALTNPTRPCKIKQITGNARREKQEDEGKELQDKEEKMYNTRKKMHDICEKAEKTTKNKH